MLQETLAESFALSIVMKKAIVTNNIWETVQWSAIGVVIGERTAEDGSESEIIHADEHSEQILYPGYSISLYKDECESYYYNLLSDNPRIFIVCRQDDVDNIMQPVLVSASYDEAAAYHESDDEVYTVPMPAELYQWLEGYVLQHYFPQKKKKRKLTNWKEDAPAEGSGGMLQ
ncbi:MAG: DUF3305 domain-containing protein [Gammaproteobacteria bacterium]|nr:DUF3305 domain-containing protein [Gammaproteobacteria bacterium]